MTRDLVEDFYRVHSESNGAGWCNCVAWWVPTWEGWGERSGVQNRNMRDSLFQSGEYDGYVCSVDGSPVGWCQVGPRDRLVKLTRQLQLDPDPDVWAITCLLVAPPNRRSRVAEAMARGVLEDLRARGIAHVQAFPKRGGDLDAIDLWTGPEALYARLGFSVERDDPVRPVYGIRLG